MEKLTEIALGVVIVLLGFLLYNQLFKQNDDLKFVKNYIENETTRYRKQDSLMDLMSTRLSVVQNLYSKSIEALEKDIADYGTTYAEALKKITDLEQLNTLQNERFKSVCDALPPRYRAGCN